MNKIVVLPYDSIWQHLYLDEQRKLKSALKDYAMQVQHVGSTAVPGLSSQPIIDMAIETKNLQLFESQIHALAELGYEQVTPEFPESLQFVKYINGDRTHQIFVFEKGSIKLHEMVAFKAYLNRFFSERERYNDVKKQLANMYPFDCHAFKQAKLIFVTVMEVKAVDWYCETYKEQQLG